MKDSSRDREHAERLKAEFEVLQNEPAVWIERAKRLKIVADFLFDELIRIRDVPQTVGTVRLKKLALVEGYLMFMGYALELSAKAILISRSPGLLNLGKRKLPKGWQTHEIALLVRALIPLTEDEEYLLRRFETYVQWAGRYSVPWEFPEFERSKHPRNMHVLSSGDKHRASQLFEKLLRIFEEEKRKRSR